MQHILVVRDSEHKLVAHPGQGNIWRDDQSVMWSFAADVEGWWSPEHQNVAVTFDPANQEHASWPGSPPAPIGTNSEPHDRRPYVATAASPNFSSSPIRYAYTMWVFDPVIKEVVSLSGTRFNFAEGGNEPIDPEIVNQPQP